MSSLQIFWVSAWWFFWYLIEVSTCLCTKWLLNINCLIYLIHKICSIFLIFLTICVFTSNRPEPVLWTKDGGELPDPDRMVVSGRELNILFLNKTDNGTYRCEATNTIGQSSAEYVLIVHGKYLLDIIICEIMNPLKNYLKFSKSLE